MDIKLASTFIKVAELNNITKAGEQLGYSQGTVTAHIQQLEQQLGVQLFDRIGRGIRLTDAGRNFRPYAIDLIRASENADAFAESWDNPAGELTIEASSSLAGGILAELLFHFHERYPDVRLTLWPNDDTAPTVERLRQSRTDFAVILDKLQPFSGCVTAISRYLPSIFIASPQDPITKKKNVPIEEILDDTFIDAPTAYEHNHTPRSSLSAYLAARDIHPGLTVASSQAVFTYLMQGKGRAFLPLLAAEPYIKKGLLARIDTEEPFSGVYIQVIYNENRWLNPQMRAFLDFIKENINA